MASGVEHTTENIGGGIMVGDGRHAIGRLAPTARGLIFESRPQSVDEQTATDVARDPERWLDALRDGFERHDRLLDRSEDPEDLLGDLACDDYEDLSDMRNHEPGLTTDAVPVSWTFALRDHAPAGTSVTDLQGVVQRRAVIAMANRLLTPDEQAAPVPTHRRPPDPDQGSGSTWVAVVCPRPCHGSGSGSGSGTRPTAAELGTA